MVARWGHSRFEFHSSKFSCADLTFLQCKSHISPGQISHLSCANLYISPVQISHFSSAKSRLPYPARLSDAHAHELHYFHLIFIVTFPLGLFEWTLNFILSQWLELVLADIEFLHAIEVLAWVVSRYGVVHMQADTSGSEKCFTKVITVAVIKSLAVSISCRWISFTKSWTDSLIVRLDVANSFDKYDAHVQSPRLDSSLWEASGASDSAAWPSCLLKIVRAGQ